MQWQILLWPERASGESRVHPAAQVFPPPHPQGPRLLVQKGLPELCYFGKVADDPKGKAALEKWLAEKDDLLAGRTPRASVEGVTIEDVADAFLTAKDALLQTSELSPQLRRLFFNVRTTSQGVWQDASGGRFAAERF